MSADESKPGGPAIDSVRVTMKMRRHTSRHRPNDLRRGNDDADVVSAQAHQRRFHVLSCVTVRADATCSRHTGPLDPTYALWDSLQRTRWPAGLFKIDGNTSRSPSNAIASSVAITQANRAIGRNGLKTNTSIPSEHTTDV